MIDPMQEAVESFGPHLFQINLLRFSFNKGRSIERSTKVLRVSAQITFVYKDRLALVFPIVYVDNHDRATSPELALDFKCELGPYSNLGMLLFRVATASCFIRGGDESRDSGGGAPPLNEPFGKKTS